MKAIVTGGAGFIGSHLVDRLLAEGHDVVVLDNFSNGKRENLKQHEQNNKLKIVECDVSNFLPSQIGDIRYSDVFKDVDWVFHLAALADIVPSIVHPLEYHRSNVDGTVNILELARAAKIKKFVYAASSSCYGILDTYPTPETAPIQPQYPYALTKYIGEEYVMHWGKIYKLPVISLRFFNVYGPRSRTSGTYGAVFGTFLAQKLAGKPFTVVGDGTQTRDFTYVTDVVEAIVKSAESEITGEIFNVGSGKPQTVNRLVELLDGDVVYIPKRPGEPDRTQADTKKIRKQLEWKPVVSFEQGVREMLTHIDYWKKAPVWTPERIQSETKEWFHYLKS